MEEDRLLVDGILQRNSSSLASAIDKYGKPVYALCARILSGQGGQEDIEECVSDVFLAAWGRIWEYESERGSFRTWLLMLAKYQALDARRRLSRSRETAAVISDLRPDHRSEDEFNCVESRQVLRKILQDLDAFDREMVYRRYYCFESIDRLARDYGLTQQAVHNRLWRIRQKMKEQLLTNGNTGVK
ncbi:MAG: sigma-70 family RNA polymerase sigma factor [Peptococcaceae bacterium]|nr:sigma-70 family RNA polymerase sigma factor [Peptococcaceae bacterium]